MRYIVDTSVWIDHLAKPITELIEILSRPASIIMHPLVLGEIFLSNSKKSNALYKELLHFPTTPIASLSEIEYFIQNYQVQGKGIGLIDVHLLYTVLENNFQLFTHDKRLQKVYKETISNYNVKLP
ncbi:MAG: type II toxin-antitoxin system VapC family toxin [Leptospira sp.]|nr:type II toxin-antitoxin system VapC family toxin [Leptospira sp.]